MSDFQTGLMISVIGLVVTFSALGIFIGIIVGLQKLFPPKKKTQETEPQAATEPIEVLAVSDAGDEEITAALAALAFIRAQRAGQLGAALLTGPGPYRTSRS